MYLNYFLIYLHYNSINLNKEYALTICSEEIIEKNKIANAFNNSEDIYKEINNCVTFFGSVNIDQKTENVVYNLSKQCINIVTGGGDSIMEAANKGAYNAKNAQSIGLNIIIPTEQKLNPYTTRNHTFNYFFSRKFMLVRHSSACVVFPGGYGTLDELFEIIILLQTEKLKNIKIYLYDTSFWNDLIVFLKKSLLKEKMINEKELGIFTLTDDLEFIEKDILKLFNQD